MSHRRLPSCPEGSQTRETYYSLTDFQLLTGRCKGTLGNRLHGAGVHPVAREARRRAHLYLRATVDPLMPTLHHPGTLVPQDLDPSIG